MKRYMLIKDVYGERAVDILNAHAKDGWRVIACVTIGKTVDSFETIMCWTLEK